MLAQPPEIRLPASTTRHGQAKYLSPEELLWLVFTSTTTIERWHSRYTSVKTPISTEAEQQSAAYTFRGTTTSQIATMNATQPDMLMLTPCTYMMAVMWSDRNMVSVMGFIGIWG